MNCLFRAFFLVYVFDQRLIKGGKRYRKLRLTKYMYTYTFTVEGLVMMMMMIIIMIAFCMQYLGKANAIIHREGE